MVAKKSIKRAPVKSAGKLVKKKTAVKSVPISATSSTQLDDFGPVYSQFKNKPVQAIRYLLKVKKGIAKDALYRKEIGYVSIPWGKNDPKTNKGFGLKHIVEKHGWEFEKLKVPVESIITFTFEHGKIIYQKTRLRFVLEAFDIRLAISTVWNGQRRRLLITAFDVKKKPRI